MDDVAMQSSVEDRWSEVRAKRVRIVEEDKDALIVYLAGLEVVLSKVNPLQLKQMLTLKAGGQLDKIFVTGANLKVYCANEDQRYKLLRADTLGDIKVTASEHVAGYKSAGHRPEQKPKERRVITGVSDELTEEEVMEETGCLKAMRMNRLDKGQKIPSRSFLLIFDQGEAPEFVTIGYTRFSTRPFIPVPTRCNKCQGFNHTAKACRGKETCSRCAGKHSFDKCPDNTQVKCANCHEAHSAAYKGCVKYQTATKVVRLAESSGLSYAAAAKRYRATTTVQAVTQNATQTVAVVQVKSTHTVETQTIPDRVEMSTQTEDSYLQTLLPPPTLPCQVSTPSRKRQPTTHDSRQTEKRAAEQKTQSQSSDESEDTWNQEEFSLETFSQPPKVKQPEAKATPGPAPEKSRKPQRGKNK